MRAKGRHLLPHTPVAAMPCAGCRALNAGRRALNAGRRALNAGRRALNAGCWTLLSLLLPLTLPAAEPSAPAIAVSAPHFDAGTVTNRFLAHAFTLRNSGTAPLSITRIRACCGASCLLGTSNLPPAAATELQVRLDLAGRSGTFRKTIYLHTSDPVHPITALRLSGRVAGAPGGGAGDFDTAVWERALQTGP